MLKRRKRKKIVLKKGTKFKRTRTTKSFIKLFRRIWSATDNKVDERSEIEEKKKKRRNRKKGIKN